MARYNVYPNPGGDGYLLDVQAEIHSLLNTRIVVPLLPLRVAPTPARTLNPHVETVVRSHNSDEARRLTQECESAVFLAEEALAQAMSRYVLDRTEARHARGTVPAALHSRI